MRSKPKCEDCGAANGTGGGALVNDWGGGENAVASCPNCSLATAAAIWWDAWATPIWTSAPNPQVYPHVDDNRVSGVIGAGGGARVLRGSGETSAELTMIPVSYDDDIPKGGGGGAAAAALLDRTGFRLQFASSALGDAQSFGTRAPLFNSTDLRPSDFRAESANSSYYAR